MFIGENLTNLRIMYGYSRKQLSELIGVTEQAVWQYENNHTSPKIQVINKLKQIFDVKNKYFYSNDILTRKMIPENIKVRNIAYRSKVVNVISKTQAEAKHLEFLDTFVNYLTAKVSYPTMKITQLRDEVIQYLDSSEDSRLIQINKVAELARKRLGFRKDTNEDLMFLVEKSGVFVFEKAIGEEIDAYSLWTCQERPYIILGNMKRSAFRRNFDIAHELGHILLHYHIDFTSLDRKEHKTIENEANSFAGIFLLPENEFVIDMKNIFHTTNPDAYMDLKKKWNTSLQVLGYRAANLGIIEAKNHRNFYAALHRKGYLKKEPLDELTPLQRPMKVKSIIDLVSKNGLIDLRQMIEDDWKVGVSFFHYLTGIDSNFFKNYLTIPHGFKFENVIDLTSRISGKGK
ncbi:helix-turn-helix domain-containing protein [Bacillus horti]|uniref:Zn-dependent peptidase ImmA (M78 family)/DNA-binding XRE family transcriptional regulator n=1 Tax=Caldalkalibacillus horti TaxID=77523 RepID=A0ABT9W1R8_9BACI|nr:XRE family transcriptional regulator [Bacillus horti]MDQ0167178.1 Zn-dependent peptidase ImmA (M78 family)/DNA-binding XRE family transcriptional regulator [Bacillus horti]